METLESSSVDTELPLTLFLQVARWNRIVRFLSASLPHYQDFWCCLLMEILIQHCCQSNASRTQEGRDQQNIKTVVFCVSKFQYNGHCGVVLHTSTFVSTCTGRTNNSFLKLKTPVAGALGEVHSPVKTPAYLEIYNFEYRIELSIRSSKCHHPYYY